MAHDLFSSLDSFVSTSVADAALMVRDVAGDYRLADADEVLLAAQRLLAARVRGADMLNSPAVVKDFLRARLPRDRGFGDSVDLLVSEQALAGRRGTRPARCTDARGAG
ncbi:MAG: hypothetical protein J0H59_20680 [Comamonadaceae bacterium]|nr:hypothetical protein [Comamonadaceae bacterium]